LRVLHTPTPSKGRTKMGCIALASFTHTPNCCRIPHADLALHLSVAAWPTSVRAGWQIPEREPPVKASWRFLSRTLCGPSLPPAFCRLPARTERGEPGVPGTATSAPGRSPAAAETPARMASPPAPRGLAYGRSQPFWSPAAAPHTSLRDAACPTAAGPVRRPGAGDGFATVPPMAPPQSLSRSLRTAAPLDARGPTSPFANSG
jgi:hypothetical protein